VRFLVDENTGVVVARWLLKNYAGQLADSFVVVTEKQVRFARALS
jgi:protein-tyrosine phosphatase